MLSSPKTGQLIPITQMSNKRNRIMNTAYPTYESTANRNSQNLTTTSTVELCNCGSKATTEVSCGWDSNNNCGAYAPSCQDCADIENGYKSPIQDELYLKQFVKVLSTEGNATESVNLALRGKCKGRYISANVHYGRDTGYHIEEDLTYPIRWINEVNKMTTPQYLASYKIAKSFNHLWAWFDGTKLEQSHLWANHYNLGNENYHQSEHNLPVSADHTASHRFEWEVEKSGKVIMKINRPQGTAITIEGKLHETPIVKIHHGITQDRHLKCLYQRLITNWKLDSEQAIEAIEAAKGYDKLGIRFGELANIVVDANW
jgi:hypothetical protein